MRKAVETANDGIIINGEKPQVRVAAGTYAQSPKTGSDNCFEILDGVNVYGAFPKTGNPGMDDRHPFISDYVYNNYAGTYSPDDYETILTPSSTSGNRRVLGQEDEYNPVRFGGSEPSYRYEQVGEGEGNYIRTADGVFTYGATWDGFTLYNGYLDSDDLQYINSSYARDGGAGARIFTGVTLSNCIVTGNKNDASTTGNSIYATQTRGGGVYCDEGTLVNCYIINNTLGKSQQYTSYGGGCYMFSGTAYNCVISENKTNGYHTDGAGIFIENAEFYNNTIVKNTSNGTARGNGGICIWTSGPSSQLTIYNCIVLGNSALTGDMIGSGDIAVSSNGGYINCNYSITSNVTNVSRNNGAITYNNSVVKSTSIFTDYNKGNYRLGSMDGVNMGIDEPVVNGKTINLADYTDMDFTDRIKDCRVDAGAYERNNADNVAPENQNGRYVYYVTWNGAESMVANSLANAACAEKLQIVLDAAGEQKKNNPSAEVVVKVAGYEDFVYHANTLANVNDPMSYSYTVPYGVVLEGGYSDQDNNWNDDGSRNAMERPTKLSAVYEGTATTQAVNGYHAVTFGKKPEGWTGTGENADAQTVIDGVWLWRSLRFV